VERQLTANQTELPEGTGNLHQGDTSRLPAIDSSRVHLERNQENAFESNIALDSIRSEKFLAQYNVGYRCIVYGIKLPLFRLKIPTIWKNYSLAA
jgi:hypothetical protein